MAISRGGRPGRIGPAGRTRVDAGADGADLVQGAGLGRMQEGAQPVEFGVRVVPLTSLALPAQPGSQGQGSRYESVLGHGQARKKGDTDLLRSRMLSISAEHDSLASSSLSRPARSAAVLPKRRSGRSDCSRFSRRSDVMIVMPVEDRPNMEEESSSLEHSSSLSIPPALDLSFPVAQET